MECKRCNGKKTVMVFDPQFAIAQFGPCPKCNLNPTDSCDSLEKALKKLAEVAP